MNLKAISLNSQSFGHLSMKLKGFLCRPTEPEFKLCRWKESEISLPGWTPNMEWAWDLGNASLKCQTQNQVKKDSLTNYLKDLSITAINHLPMERLSRRETHKEFSPSRIQNNTRESLDKRGQMSNISTIDLTSSMVWSTRQMEISWGDFS